MNLRLPIDVLAVLKHLIDSGFEAYIVGGAVRDLIVGKDIPTDWDFTTNATPDQIQELFTDSFYENDFGTVGISRENIREQFKLPALTSESEQSEAYSQVVKVEEATKIHESLVKHQNNLDNEILSLRSRMTVKNDGDFRSTNFEITTFRSDGVYNDFRRPESVSWGSTLEEDLLRRDFTINALAIHVDTNEFKFDSQQELIAISEKNLNIIDQHDGIQHLANKLIVTVGNPNARLQEDALRMMRAIRFAVQLDFQIDSATAKAIRKHAKLISHISQERIRDELLKILASPLPKLGIELLDKSGLLQYILPEVLAMKGIEQGGHHTTDVWTHSLDALQTCPSHDPIVRLGTLLHDISKPETFAIRDGNITFYNHEIVGSRVAQKIAKRLKLSKKDTARIFTLVRYHMFHYDTKMTDAAIRRFMRKVGLENVNDILDLRIGDRLGSGARETSWRMEEMKSRMQAQLHQPFDVNDLKIDGNDLISELKLKPGKIIGETLKHLTSIVLEKPELNTREELMKIARDFIKTAQKK